jgi:hypothetical protein
VNNSQLDLLPLATNTPPCEVRVQIGPIARDIVIYVTRQAVYRRAEPMRTKIMPTPDWLLLKRNCWEVECHSESDDGADGIGNYWKGCCLMERFWITSRDPEAMTADDRRREVSTILAAGLLRRIRQPKGATLNVCQASSPRSQIALDVPQETRLSVSK